MVGEITSLRGPAAPLDPAALADREAICRVCQIYALSVDTRDEDMLRSIFAPNAIMRGWLGEFTAEDYPPYLLQGVKAYHATMHSILNQYVVITGDTAKLRSYAVAYHIHAPESGIEDLVMGVQYRDNVERGPRGWWIVSREVAHIWARGPLPPRGRPKAAARKK